MKIRSLQFTLIELVSVLVVLVLIISLLTPAFAKARNEAQVNSCRTQLRQLGIALAMYCDSNDDVMAAAQGNIEEGWTFKLAPYLGAHFETRPGESPAAYRCPAQETFFKMNYMVSYGMHSLSSDPERENTAWIKRSEWKNTRGILADTGTSTYPWKIDENWRNVTSKFPHASSESNTLYIDGSTQMIAFDKFHSYWWKGI